MNLNTILVILVLIIFVLIIIIQQYISFKKIKEEPEEPEKEDYIPSSYNTLSGDSRLLEISPAKKCELGIYTWGSKDSDTYKYCSDPKNWPSIASETCNKGFSGRPVIFEYTPDSNSTWDNDRYIDINEIKAPSVL